MRIKAYRVKKGAIRSLIVVTLLLIMANNKAEGADLSYTKIDQIDASNGMLSNNVLDITQDKYGFMWIGTAEGLNRYDGVNFRSFTKNSVFDKISNNYVQKTFPAKDGNLFFATPNGLNVYDYKNDKIKILTSENSGLSSSDIVSFSEAPMGMWIGTYDNDVSFYDYKTQKISVLKLPDTIKKSRVTALYYDKLNNLWVGTLTGGLYRRDKSGTFHYYPTDRVEEIIEDGNGHIWIAAGKLYHYNVENCKFEAVPINCNIKVTRLELGINDMIWVGGIEGVGYFYLKEYGKTKSVSFHEVKTYNSAYNQSVVYVNSIKLDRDNNIWVSTFGNGLFLIHNKANKFLHIDSDVPNDKSLTIRHVNAVLCDKNNVYVGSKGGGIDILNSDFEKTGRYTKSKNGLCSDNINCIYSDSNHDLWVGTRNGISHLRNGSSKFNNYVRTSGEADNQLLSNVIYDFVEDKEKRLWIATDMGITYYKDGKFNNEFYKKTQRRIDCRDIVKVGDELWISTYGDGIISYNTKTKEIIRYYSRSDKMDNYVVCIKHKGDILYVATFGNGLKLFSISQKKFIKTYNISSGLKSDYVQDIEISNDGNVWIAYNKGISLIKNGEIKHFNNKNGVFCQEIMGGTKFHLNGIEKIAFCGEKGLIIFNPIDLPQDKAVYKPIFTSLKVFNQNIFPDSEESHGSSPLDTNIILTPSIKLSYNQILFTLEFALLDYNNTQLTQYAYRLNTDKDWIDLGNNGFVTFRNLAPGKYKLYVKSIYPSGSSDENVSSVELIITPPFYRTAIAYVIYAFLLIGIMYAVIKYTSNRASVKHKMALESAKRIKEEELNMAKQQFFINISHELRTPLTLIIGPLETLKSKYPQLNDELKLIMQNTQRLLSLVNQLLDFRKSEMNQMKLKVRYASLTKQINDVASRFEALKEEKKMNISFLSSPMNLYAWYDSDFMEKIVSNLLSNAYKFSPIGSNINISVQQFNKGNELWAKLEIADEGCGISQSDIPYIFDRFYQSRNSGMPNKGSGIGLHLVKSLVELHYGIITVESELNKGTIFKVELPIDKYYYQPNEIAGEDMVREESKKDEENDKKQEEVIKAEEPIMQSGQCSTILVVDDEQEICDYIKSILSDNYQIISANDGKEALAILSQQEFDLIISDVMMPEMDGITLCSKIKNNVETSHIPIILLTAKDSIERKIDGIKSGADSYIFKPFHPDHLRIRVEKLIESREQFRKKFNKNYAIEIEHSQSLSFDEELLQRIIKYITDNMADPKLNGDMIATEVSISRMTLHRKLKTLTGQSTSNLIRGVRLKEAVYQIENTDKRISDICFEVGFNSMSYFASCFASQYGYSPTDYRANFSKDKRKPH